MHATVKTPVRMGGMRIVWLLSPLSILLTTCTENTERYLKPNIVLIVADDLGYGDIGCYGGEIHTPNIDALAENGVRFSHFHTAPMCAPTRAMLLSGNDHHIAGVGIQGRTSEQFGYEGRLTERIVPVPWLLREAGYHTYMAGKWHLGDTPESNPHQNGFERSFALLEGAGNHYSGQSALGDGKSMYTEDGDSVSWITGNYSTDFYTDKLIEYIDQNRNDRKPFFAYAAYTSPHWPLQVDKKYREKYTGIYDEGYEKLRGKRMNGLKMAGIIPAEYSSPPVHGSVEPWDSLSEMEQLKEARKMEIYAGMVDNLDMNIGRLTDYLKSIVRYENTVFVFMSDNGADYRDFINLPGRSEILRLYYNDDYENMGSENSYISYGPGWAEAGSAPFRYFKDYSTQGGINTTLVISGPGVDRKDEVHAGFATVQDLAPTFYELAHVEYPDSINNHQVYPLRGRSLMPFLSGRTDKIHDTGYVFALEHIGYAMVRKGSWKITKMMEPSEGNGFALYDLSEDMGEQNDLRDVLPAKYQELLEEWEKYADEIKLGK
jgi:arylsulfatase A-like enzyme